MQHSQNQINGWVKRLADMMGWKPHTLAEWSNVDYACETDIPKSGEWSQEHLEHAVSFLDHSFYEWGQDPKEFNTTPESVSEGQKVINAVRSEMGFEL